ncbi:class I SAM-dependent methyltransferase [Streptomyces sp. SL13]|uniref:Class I SAM-dependent methyltransferase n=1 Tax=Streptantibioticus silvisoli TaxID=2705255 RepID=A0AA90H5J8_9ACTN|nr:class I SAM-dependent methyltransferase [Streptantibioticus silvisoli]MDI5971641.1 class I SAM-dependent methyltransferase [Streptantibioticus silvisoli]
MVRVLDRFNAAHPWDHNAHYHRAILRALPGRAASALDVGCGSGELARRLAGRVGRVVGVDADPVIVRRAREATRAGAAVEFLVAGAPDGLPPGPFDVVTCVAALHHLPFTGALEAFRDRLAPGGTLVVVGCYRATTRSDHLLGLAALPVNAAVGWLATGGRRAPRPVAMTAPTREPQMAYADIVREARRVLPGARARRRLFWRYVLVWRAGGRGQRASIVTENANRSPR